MKGDGVRCWRCGEIIPWSSDVCPKCGLEQDPQTFLDDPEWDCVLDDCTVLGGCGFPLAVDDVVSVHFSESGVIIRGPHPDITLEYRDLLDVGLSGPGVVTRGGGFIGGGFGVKGALKGIAVSTVLNRLTTKTTILSVVQLVCIERELFLLFSGAEPAVLRIELSPVFMALEGARRRLID